MSKKNKYSLNSTIKSKIKKMGRGSEQTLPHEDIQMANKNMKKNFIITDYQRNVNQNDNEG